jgi:hypothetical protein
MYQSTIDFDAGIAHTAQDGIGNAQPRFVALTAAQAGA